MKRNSKEWKEKREKFLNGRTCSWCGSSDSLCVHTAKEFTAAAVSSEIYSAAYSRFKEIYKHEYQAFERIPTGRHRHISHPVWHKASTIHKTEPDHTELEEQYVEVLVKDSQEGNFKKLYHEWLEETGIKALIEEEVRKAEDEYESLKNAIVLCKRCHFASLRDMELCPICKSKYKPLRYKTCFDCLPEEKKGLLEKQKRDQAD